MILDKNHYNFLKESYELVGSKINDKKDFDPANLKHSISLFENSTHNKPVPIEVDVYAILSGISFDENFLNYVSKIQKKIKKTLGNKRSYFVEPSNLGVEYAVLKWPDDVLHDNVLEDAKRILNEIEYTSFFLNVFGIQVHEDGCIILKCVDEDKLIFKLRDLLKLGIKNIPEKQSSWAHIPLGRILSPIGRDRMKELKHVISIIDNELNYNILINCVHLVHETKWYMEQKKYLVSKKFKKR